MMPDIDNIPKPALLLGWAGVLPFAGMSLALLLGFPSPGIRLESLLVSYAAIILSFMGGVHWGLAMKSLDDDGFAGSAWHYLLGVIPALVGCTAVAIEAYAFAILSVAFFALLFLDMAWASGRCAPAWYGRLRLQLTATVLLCLGVAWSAT